MPCGDCGEKEYYALRDRMSVVLWCLQELASGKPGEYPGDGDHPIVKAWRDNRWVEDNIDRATAELCGILSSKESEYIQLCSLELQRWWIQHQIDDGDRHA